MGSPEDAYLLEQILRRPHGRLRWVIVELSRLGTGVDREATLRFRYWHDTARLKLVAQRLWGQAIEVQTRLEQNGAATLGARYEIWSTMAGKQCGHLRCWLMNVTNLGSATDVLDRWRRAGPPRDDARGDLGDQGDGWVSAGLDRQQMTPEEREKYLRSYAERLAEPAGKERGDEVSQSALEQLLDTIITASALFPCWFIPPDDVWAGIFSHRGAGAGAGDSRFFRCARERRIVYAGTADRCDSPQFRGCGVVQRGAGPEIYGAGKTEGDEAVKSPDLSRMRWLSLG